MYGNDAKRRRLLGEAIRFVSSKGWSTLDIAKALSLSLPAVHDLRGADNGGSGPVLYSISEVAARIGIGKSTLRRLVVKRQVTGQRVALGNPRSAYRMTGAEANKLAYRSRRATEATFREVWDHGDDQGAEVAYGEERDDKEYAR